MPRQKTRLKRNSFKKSANNSQFISAKEKVAQKRQAQQARAKLINLSFISVFLGLAIGLSAMAINLKLGLGLALLVPSLILSYAYPRTALWLFLIYMPFSGTFVYWVGGGNPILQLSKDVFYIPALLALIIDARRRNKKIFVKEQLVPTLAILFVISLITLLLANGAKEFLPFCKDLADPYLRDANGDLVINPQTGIVILLPCKKGIPFLQGILGLKVLLGYVPLIFCGYYLIDSKEKLFFLGRLLVILAIVCCSLALVQYFYLKTGRCIGTRGATGDELFKASLQAKCLVGGSLLYSPSQGQIRLPGTFVSPWHWAWFLIANSAITFTVAFGDPMRRWRIVGITGLILVVINSVICGQRIALALVFGFIVLLIFTSGLFLRLQKFIPFLILLIVPLVYIAINNPDVVQARVDSFVTRWNTSPPHIFIANQLKLAWANQKGILGNGLGTATSSTRVFGDISLIETFHAKLLSEIGLIGLIAFIAFVAHLTILTFADYRSLKTEVLKNFGICFWSFIFLISFFPYWYPLDTDPVNVYYWLFAGILFRLPDLDKKEQKRLQIENAGEKTSPRLLRRRKLRPR